MTTTGGTLPACRIELPSPVCTAPTGTRAICGAPGAAIPPPAPAPAAAAFNAAADFDAAASFAAAAAFDAAAADADAAAVLGFGVADALGGTTGAAHVGRMIVS